MTDPVVLPPIPTVDALILELNKAQRPILERWSQSQGPSSGMTPEQIIAELLKRAGYGPIGLPGPAKPADPATPTAPNLDKNVTAASVVALLFSAFLQYNGIAGTPFGMFSDPTVAGTALTSIPAIGVGLGALNVVTPIIEGLKRLFGIGPK